jgi:hypothetical protein
LMAYGAEARRACQDGSVYVFNTTSKDLPGWNPMA